MIGGWLAMPTDAFNLRGPGDVFVHFPYLLPCLVSAAYNLVVFLGALIFLEETNERLLKEQKAVRSENITATIDENAPLLEPRALSTVSSARVQEKGANTSQEIFVLIAATR
jgi:hypothetical protein